MAILIFLKLLTISKSNKITNNLDTVTSEINQGRTYARIAQEEDLHSLDVHVIDTTTIQVTTDQPQSSEDVDAFVTHKYWDELNRFGFTKRQETYFGG